MATSENETPKVAVQDAAPEAAAEDAAVDEARSADSVPDTPAYVELPSGAALDASDCAPVLREHPTQLIVLAGSEASGKTTLLASIYESLQEGAFEKLQFSGSRSLIGFEQVCHLNRLLSGQLAPDTERTKPLEQAVFYHLSLLDTETEDNLGRRDVLLSAVSGELFRLARDSTEGSTALSFVRRADVLAVLVDGAKLAELEERERALADAQLLLRSLLDADMVCPHTRVEFVFSKYDCIQGAGSVAEKFARGAKNRLVATFRARVPYLECRDIAARPVESRLPFAFGVGQALRSWLTTVPLHLTALPSADEPSDSGREFSRFGWRFRLREGGTP